MSKNNQKSIKKDRMEYEMKILEVVQYLFALDFMTHIITFFPFFPKHMILTDLTSKITNVLSTNHLTNSTLLQ